MRVLQVDALLGLPWMCGQLISDDSALRLRLAAGMTRSVSGPSLCAANADADADADAEILAERLAATALRDCNESANSRATAGTAVAIELPFAAATVERVPCLRVCQTSESAASPAQRRRYRSVEEYALAGFSVVDL